MKIKNIQIKKIDFDNKINGIIIKSESNKLDINKLDKKIIRNNFFKHGLIIFDNFKINPENFFLLTKRFTSAYANDAFRREIKFDNKSLRSVDLGNKRVTLHSESSFTLTRPKIIWFMCITPPKKIEGGETTICDGQQLWNNLKIDTKIFFKKNPMIYSVKVKIQNYNKKDKKKWYLNEVGIYDEIIDYSKNRIFFKNKQFAVERNYFSNELVFANHLLSVKDEDQIEKVFYGDNQKIPKEYLNDIIETSKKLTYSHKWKKNQIIMIDNYRFMHGRNKINGNSKREIINSQTLITNF